MVLDRNLSSPEWGALTVFALATLANLWGNYMAMDSYVLISKPLLMTSLILFFILHNTYTKSYYLFLLGMTFSLAGDLFLLFNTSGSDGFFLAGLSSFLLGHIAYYSAFNRFVSDLFPDNNKKTTFLLPGIIVFITIIFLAQLIPYVDGAMRLPVTVYAMVITLMMIGASKLNTLIHTRISLWLLIGALTFAVSDCILSLSLFRFESDAPGFRLSIMATYILAQFLLATQFKRLLKEKN